MSGEYQRWALLVKGNRLSPDMLLGPLCWPNTEPGPTVTFPTRQQAREAKRQLHSYRKCAQPIKVIMTIVAGP